VSAGRRYWLGVGVIAVVTAAIAGTLGTTSGAGVWLALGMTLAIQAPLGWWLIRAVGRGQAVGVWALGMAVRLGLVALTGLVLLPALDWPPGPGLVGLATLLLALLLLEGLVLWLEHFGSEAR